MILLASGADMGIDREIDLTSIRLILAPTSNPRVTEFARDSSTLSLSLNTFTDLLISKPGGLSETDLSGRQQS